MSYREISLKLQQIKPINNIIICICMYVFFMVNCQYFDYYQQKKKKYEEPFILHK